MTLSTEAITSFKEIYVKQFGEQLLDAEAEQKGLAMLRLFKVVYTESAPRGWKKEIRSKYEQA